MEFRTLKANEIDCRVGTCSDKGCSLLLYKDARVDMSLLDEVLGSENWQRKHQLINGQLFCSVGIKTNSGEWIWKEDVGTESNTEAVKGQASDAFKRACVNVGIGRELYTAPFIWISAENVNIVQGRNGKPTTMDKFKVKRIEYNEAREIIGLEIVNLKRGTVVFKLGDGTSAPKPIPISNQGSAVEEAEARAKLIKYVNERNWDVKTLEKLLKGYKVKSLQEMTLEKCNHYFSYLRKNGVEI